MEFVFIFFPLGLHFNRTFFLQSFWVAMRCVLGTNTVLVFRVVGFAITLTTTVFESTTWELGNNPEPTATISQRQNFPTIYGFGIITSHIMLQGDKYTE